MNSSVLAIIEPNLIHGIENHISINIQKDSNVNRNYLLSLRKDNRLQADSRIVYIYSLDGEYFSYPREKSEIIYIGEACRSSEATGERFGQHISTDSEHGGDFGSNYTLSYYYYSNKKLRLDIFCLRKDVNQKDVEKKLLQWFVKTHCSQPIAQGTCGENYTINCLNNV
jgi:hypothetical protein